MAEHKLTQAQHRVLADCVQRHEKYGLPTRVEEPQNHEHARALIRAGAAEWYPPISPLAAVMAQHAGRLGDLIANRQMIVPTDRGRVRVTAAKGGKRGKRN